MNTIQELKYYCEIENPAGAILLTGEWGCGKTHLIEHVLREELKESHIIFRVSLFGIQDIEAVHKAIKKEWLNIQGGIYKKTEQAKKKVNPLMEIASKLPQIKEAAGVVKNVFSVDILEFVKVENKKGDKKIVIVFDDLERSDLKPTEILGVINDYCENQHFNIIVIANEDKTNTDTINGELSFKEIKEKIIQRTINYHPEYDKVIAGVIEEITENESEYRQFLEDNKEYLHIMFSGQEANDTPLVKETYYEMSKEFYKSEGKDNNRKKSLLLQKQHNIRSFKVAIQDFSRIYSILQEKEINDKDKWLFSFVACTLAAKAGLYEKHESYGYIFANNDLSILYPVFYGSEYLPDCLCNWITNGIWDEESIEWFFNDVKKKQNQIRDPGALVKTERIDYLDEDIVNKGFGEVLKSAYDGMLTLDEYVVLILNSSIARFYEFELPEQINWKKIRAGITVRIQKIKDGELEEEILRHSITERNDLNTEEKETYHMISNCFQQGLFMFDKNQKLYIELMETDHNKAFRICQGKRFNCFTEEMAIVTANAFEQADNYDKIVFSSSFEGILGFSQINDDFLKGPLEDTIKGLNKLVELLNALFERYKNKPFAKRNTKVFIDSVQKELKEIDEKRKCN